MSRRLFLYIFGILLTILTLSSCRHSAPQQLVPLLHNTSKFDQLSYLLSTAYVEDVNTDSITDIAMEEMIKALDPHSAYIPAKDLEDVNSELSGSFSGIGIQFTIQQDTIRVVAVIGGGPSEHIGVLAGDMIVEVDDTAFVGKSITNEKVIRHLRGPKGTEVKIGVRRSGTDEMLHYTITRGDIPVKSVDATFMIEPGIGFISVNKFGENTYSEFLSGLATLRAKGAKSLIVDLRQNSGGFMEQAVRMANEFLNRDELIVYAEGRAYPRYEALATGGGRFRSEKLVVLIDDFSASASEIFAGAMQDNDRATIIGRRSFGKGLVQQQIPFSDGSAVRLTVARYYTPSGRCIQKPYTLGEGEDYQLDLLERFDRGEFFSADSIHVKDTTRYYTRSGRVVYGGGGIMPDVFVGRDTTENSPYANRVINYAYTYQYAYRYVDQHRQTLNRYTDWREMEQYLISQDLLPDFVDFCRQKGVEPVEAQIQKSRPMLLRLIHAYIVRDVLGDEGFFPLYERDDEITRRAVAYILSGEGE